jgi:hypothetical protein
MIRSLVNSLRRPRVSVFQSPDLVRMLSGDPELLAIADAVAVTLPMPARASRRRPAVAMMAAAVAVVALAIAFWPGGQTPSLVDRALAAVGDGAVIHVVATSDTGYNLISLANGRSVPQTQTTEMWFDGTKHLKHTIISSNGTVLDDMLETATGGSSTFGGVYSCTWVREHPAEARLRNIACPAAAGAGVPSPALDPGLSNFVDGYREALRAGTFKEAGSGRVNGVDVKFLDMPLAPSVGQQAVERVAVDVGSGRPVQIENKAGTASVVSYRVKQIESQSTEGANFAPPKVATSVPVSGAVGTSTVISLTDAPSVVPNALQVDAGKTGASLERANHDQLRADFATASGQERRSSDGVRLEYVMPSGARLTLLESVDAAAAYGWPVRAPDPPAGFMMTNGLSGFVVIGGVHVVIRAAPSDLLAVVQTLTRIA